MCEKSFEKHLLENPFNLMNLSDAPTWWEMSANLSHLVRFSFLPHCYFHFDLIMIFTLIWLWCHFEMIVIFALTLLWFSLWDDFAFDLVMIFGLSVVEHMLTSLSTRHLLVRAHDLEKTAAAVKIDVSHFRRHFRHCIVTTMTVPWVTRVLPLAVELAWFFVGLFG